MAHNNMKMTAQSTTLLDTDVASLSHSSGDDSTTSDSATEFPSPPRIQPPSPKTDSTTNGLAKITMASASRQYTEWTDPTGLRVQHMSWVIPEHYQWDTSFDGYPWVCSLRTCRKCFDTSYGLAQHFVTSPLQPARPIPFSPTDH